MYDPNNYNAEYNKTLENLDEWTERALLSVFAYLGVPKSYLDVGCGSGRTIHTAHALVGNVLGIELFLHVYYRRQIIRHHDLREPLTLDQRYDLVTCWEVGEHLPPESADVLCDTLAKHTERYLVFTAAHPNQGGDFHINEQPPEYWQAKLESRGLTHHAEHTERLRDIWVYTTGPAWWLPTNVQVFERI